MLNEKYPFELPPLPYSYNALEPYIDEQTVFIHHNKHFKAYVDNLNNIISEYPQYQDMTLEEIIRCIPSLPPNIKSQVKNNAGGVFNHYLYFEIMGGNRSEPSQELEHMINCSYGSMERFKDTMKKAAMNIFGSGWAWLVVDRYGNFRIATTSNQDTVVMFDVFPVLNIDVWEHAYYLKYKNNRNEYIDAFLKIVDFNKVNDLYEKNI